MYCHKVFFSSVFVSQHDRLKKAPVSCWEQDGIRFWSAGPRRPVAGHPSSADSSTAIEFTASCLPEATGATVRGKTTGQRSIILCLLFLNLWMCAVLLEAMTAVSNCETIMWYERMVQICHFTLCLRAYWTIRQPTRGQRSHGLVNSPSAIFL